MQQKILIEKKEMQQKILNEKNIIIKEQKEMINNLIEKLSKYLIDPKQNHKEKNQLFELAVNSQELNNKTQNSMLQIAKLYKDAPDYKIPDKFELTYDDFDEFINKDLMIGTKDIF